MSCFRAVFFSLLLFNLCTVQVGAEEIVLPVEEEPLAPLTKQERNQRLGQTTLVGVGFVTLWGIWQWDYFSSAPHAQSEGWFGNETANGGADKLGHAYSTYIFSHGLAALYEHWRFEEEDAALYGALSSFAIMGYMELGDAFSEYGLSYEDMLANGAGALLGYVLYRDADLASKIDLRWEFGFKPNKGDFFTDYENSKFLLACKLNGFAVAKDTMWRHVEMHLSYYTRGFEDEEVDRVRKIYVGIGLNLTDLLSRQGWKEIATALRYIQLPYTSITAEHDFNK